MTSLLLLFLNCQVFCSPTLSQESTASLCWPPTRTQWTPFRLGGMQWSLRFILDPPDFFIGLIWRKKKKARITEMGTQSQMPPETTSFFWQSALAPRAPRGFSFLDTEEVRTEKLQRIELQQLLFFLFFVFNFSPAGAKTYGLPPSYPLCKKVCTDIAQMIQAVWTAS